MNIKGYWSKNIFNSIHWQFVCFKLSFIIVAFYSVFYWIYKWNFQSHQYYLNYAFSMFISFCFAIRYYLMASLNLDLYIQIFSHTKKNKINIKQFYMLWYFEYKIFFVRISLWYFDPFVLLNKCFMLYNV